MELTTLTPVHKKILDALEDGSWRTRQELATAMRRTQSKLYPMDFIRLEELEDARLIEVRVHRKPHLYYTYRKVKA